jgi:F-type H+-transporting ATPase subunit c
MRKNLKPFALLLFFLLLASAPLLAQETEEAQGTPLTERRAKLFMLSLIVGGAIITLTVAAGAFSQAKSISSACEGISRNPGSGPHIRVPLIFALVLIETLVIYALLITIIILMVQWGKYT